MSNRMRDPKNGKFAAVTGSGGGGSGKGGSSSRQAIEAPNTLRSKAIARVLIAYSEGPVGGINSYKNIYLDETPLMAADGSINFPGVDAEERYGQPTQTACSGFSQAENTIQVNTDIKVATGPVVRQISAASIDSVRIVMTFPSLVVVDTKTGDQNGTAVAFNIERRDDVVGVWENTGTMQVSGKCVSPYQKAFRVNRPTGTAKWSFRITRVTPDSTVTTLQNSTVLASYSEIEESPNTYPNTALLAIKVDTSLFGNGIPTISMRADGVLVAVPSNYNQGNLLPGQTAYAGIWDGTWKYESTSNPVWTIYDLITSNRYGMGIDSAYIDKFALYALARYCDGVDSNGVFVGVPDGLGGFRPRFTFQTQVNTQEDAMNLIQTMVGAIRGLAYWGAGVVQLNTDRPKQSVKLIAPENVIDGKFTYSGTEAKERYTEANVTYNNPNDFFRQDITTYLSDVAAARYPRNVLQVTKYGCANEAEALMYGKWMVDTSITQTETINFTGGIECGVIRPGDVFEVADPKYQGSKWSGRVMPGSTAGLLVTEGEITLTAGKSYTVRVVDSNGQTIMSGPVTNNKNGAPATSFSVSLPQTPVVPHVFIISGDDIASRLYTCMASTEQDDFSYEIVGVNYDPNKFLRVEQNIILDDDPYSKIDVANVQPPSNLSFAVVSRTDAILGPRNDLQVKWTASISPLVTTYQVYHRVSSGQFTEVGLTEVADITIKDIVPGIHEVQVVAINVAGRSSPALLGSYTFNYGGKSDLAPPVNLYVKGTTGGVFASPNATVTWQDNPSNNTMATAVIGWEVRVMTDDANKTILFTQYIGNPATTEFTYTYAQNSASGGPRRNFRIEVLAADAQGRRSDPTPLSVSNPPPAVPGGVSLIAFFTAYRLIHNRPVETDAVGTLIFASKTPGVTASVGTQVYEGTGTFHDVEAEGATTYYVKFAIYDTFSRDPNLLTISSEYTVTTVNDQTVIQPPATPQNLRLTSTAKNGVVQINATWDALAAGTFSSYEVSASQNNNLNYLGGYMTGTNSYVIPGVNPLTTYYIRVRAKNAVKDSGFSIESSIVTVAADGTGIIQNAPQPPTAVAATASFKSVFLTWKAPAAGGPVNYYEVLESVTNNVANASIIGSSTGAGYTRGGLNSGDSRFYWVRSVGPGGTSANAPNTTTGVIGTTVLLATADFQNLSIVNALIADATIDDAKIVSLNATKIKADTVLAGSIRIDGANTQTTLANTANVAVAGVNNAAAAQGTANKGVTDAAAAQAQANKGVNDAAGALGAANAAQATANLDPATRINQAATQIDPGRILIAGGTTLANWRNGGDVTSIEGGKIAANTIRANSVQIGVRGIQLTGIVFSPDKYNNRMNWTAGQIRFINDAGAVQTIEVAANNSANNLGTPSQPLYILWVKGRNYFDYVYDLNVAFNGEYIILCTYNGGINFVNNYGGTTIDGDQIITGTIKANRIEANSIGANQITTGELITNQAQIRTGILTTAHIQNAYINNAQISGDIASSNWSGGGNGQPGSATGWYLQRSGKLYANDIEIRDNSGYILFQSGGNLDWNRVSNKPGEFPSNWNAISGKPSEYFINYINVGNRPYLGQFSALDVISRGNIGTYIAGAAIGEAWIENGAISNAKIGNAQIDTIKVANYAVSSFVMSDYDNGNLYPVINWQHPGWDWNSLGNVGVSMNYPGRMFIQSINRHFTFFQNFGTYYRGFAATCQQLIWRPPWAGGNWGSIDEHNMFIDLQGNGIYEVSYQYPIIYNLSWGGEVPNGYYEIWYRLFGNTAYLTSSEWHFNFNRNRILIHYSYR